LGVTDKDGFITLSGVTSKDVISFNYQGYQAATVSRNGDKVTVQSGLSGTNQFWVTPHQFFTNSRSTILIPLARRFEGQ
jgi:hypothetical protein